MTGRLEHATARLRAVRRLPDRVTRRRRDRALLDELFDPDFYLESNPDVAAAGVDPRHHYLRSGVEEHRSPSPLFDPQWYLARYPDVGQAGLDPVLHYLSFGAGEGRDPHPLFCTSWYAAAYPDVVEQGINPLVHFLHFGAKERRDPHPLFDTAWYLAEYPEVAASGANPLVDYVRGGAEAGRNPNPYFYSQWYLHQYPDARTAGLNPLVHYAEAGEREGYQTNPSGTVPRRPVDVAAGAARLKAAGRSDTRSVPFLLESRWPALAPLEVFRTTGPGRVTVVTDSVGADSLYGGVATALILACLWAAEQGREIRVVTRTAAPDATGLARLSSLYDLEIIGNPQFVQHAPGSRVPLDLRPDDVFLTTSWWTTAATIPSVAPERVVYLLQEDERMFFASGDDALRAGLVMSDPRPMVVVNSARLRDHLVATGCTNLVDHGMAFEPSFELFSRIRHRENPPGERQLFFYSRPNNLRNLFYLGVQVLDDAFASGVLDPAEWTVHLVGPGTPELDFAGGPRVQYHPSLDWGEYADLIGGMDLGLSLMATPHTSYPPLDLVAAGAVVVTNSWPGKSGLEAFGPRLVTGEPNRDGLLSAVAKAAGLIGTGPSREAVEELRVPWSQALHGVVARLAEEYPVV